MLKIFKRKLIVIKNINKQKTGEEHVIDVATMDLATGGIEVHFAIPVVYKKVFVGVSFYVECRPGSLPADILPSGNSSPIAHLDNVFIARGYSSCNKLSERDIELFVK